jgi:hypothetical protein
MDLAVALRLLQFAAAIHGAHRYRLAATERVTVTLPLGVVLRAKPHLATGSVAAFVH